MDYETFRRRAVRFEELARREPGTYRRRLVLLVGAGYGYVLGLLALLLALNLLMVWVLLNTRAYAAGVKLELAVLVLTGVVLRSLWVRLEPPPGLRVERAQAPALFAMVDDLRERLKAAPVHVVQLTGEVNASMAQVPRLGIFGFHRNYLSIGLPLLEGMSEAQVRAVVAHELAHLSARHSRTSAWIYRVSATWHRLVASLEERGGGAAWLVRPFFRRYVPYFDAFTLVLSRESEFEADRLAAAAVGAGTAAAALARSHVLAKVDERSGQEMSRLVVQHATPPCGPVSLFARHAREPVEPAHAEAWVRAAMDQASDTFSTHPPLGARLAALGCAEPPAEAAAVPAASAAGALLGAHAARAAETLDGMWKSRIAAHWRQRHQEARRERERLGELERLEAQRGLDAGEALERAHLAEAHLGAEVALPLLFDAVERHPDAPELRLRLGMLLLDAGDESGLAQVEAAAAAEPGLEFVACQAAYAFLAARGRVAEAEAYRGRAMGEAARMEAASEERSTLRPKEVFLPHGLDAAALAHVAAVLDGARRVARGHLVRRQMKEMPESPAYLLLLELSKPFWADAPDDGQVAQAVVNHLALAGHVTVATALDRGPRRRVRKTPGALVYARGAAAPVPVSAVPA